MASIHHRHEGKQLIGPITQYTVNFKDVFHLDNLYVLMHEWLVENEYATRDDSKFPEVFYLSKQGPAGKEIWWRWRPTKLPLGEKNPFWQFALDVDAHVLGLKDVEAVLEGKKYAAHKGEVEINVVANVVLDYKKALEKHPLLKPFKKILLERTWKPTLDRLKKDLYADAHKFRDAINVYLKLETYLGGKEMPEYYPKRVPE